MGTMINRRRAYGGKSLPYDAEIEYLESSGTQYIDTQINISGSLGVETAAYTVEGEGFPFGGRKGYQNSSFLVKRNQDNTLAFAYGASEILLINNPVGGNHSFSYIGNIVKYDDRTIECSRRTFVTNLHFILFGSNMNNTISIGVAKVRFYYFKLFNNDILIRDFIPVRVGNVGYMYDKVSGQLFGNAGTGNFILGSDK